MHLGDKGSDERIYFKIDWALINDVCLTNMPSCKTTFLPEDINNHCPIKIDLTDERKMKQRSFLYCNAWGKVPQFHYLMKVGWEVTIQGCKMLQIVKKFK